MRVTDTRYAREKTQLELALRMIGHEARTCTIRTCTGLSDDRIRKIYSTYFKQPGRRGIRRQRGKSPSQTAIYVKTVQHQFEATTLAKLCLTAGVARFDGKATGTRPSRRGIGFGQRICRAYEAYRVLHDKPIYSLERAFALIDGLVSGEELALKTCDTCANVYVHDPLSLDALLCPCCRLKGLSAPGRRTATVRARPSPDRPRAQAAGTR